MFICSSTAGFMKTVPLVYTILINTFYLSQSRQVAEGAEGAEGAEETVFRKHTVCQDYV